MPADSGRYGRAILLLDDEPDITSVMSVALKAAGCSVNTFNDPMTALSDFEASVQGSGKSRKYGLVISDIRMPGMDGFEFARRVSAIDGEVKIVLITAYEVKKKEFDSVLPALRIDALLNKPVRMTRLNDIVSTLLSEYVSPKGSHEQVTKTPLRE